jgi:hypothetical protein
MVTATKELHARMVTCRQRSKLFCVVLRVGNGN